MIKESIIFRVALIISTTIHIGGFGLMWRDNYSFLQNGLGKLKDNIIVFEIGWVETGKMYVRGVVEEKNDRDGLQKALKIKKGDSHLFPKTGSSGYAEEDMGGVSNEYLLEVRRCIERVKFYPREARRRLLIGGATVSFYIDCNGNPGDICIIKSSGSVILDNTAKEMVLRASPFPKPPANKYIQTTIVFKI